MHYGLDDIDIKEMEGNTFVSVNDGGDVLSFKMEDGTSYVFYHYQDCCENVQIEDIVGDLSDLEGTPLLQAEKVSSEQKDDPENYESCTWTFYKFATIKGSVTVRWLGISNGYYSESVDLRKDAA